MIEPPFLDGLSPLARQFGLRVSAWSAAPSEALVLAGALTVRSRAEGHTCLPLKRIAGHPMKEVVEGATSSLRLPALEDWVPILVRSGVVADRTKQADSGTMAVDSDHAPPPLVLGPDFRLYLHRYWAYEQEAAGHLLRRASRMSPGDPEQLKVALRRFFPTSNGTEFDWQALAAFSALRRGLTIISGGPGTGKTRTIAWHLGVLAELAGSSTVRVRLSAPTGKAASRLSEAIRQAVESMPAHLPKPDISWREAVTVHRLLGIRPGDRGGDVEAAASLAADVVVVDEASMLDLALLVRLLRALPDEARLILVGDQNQLAAVEAGSVLGEVWAAPVAGCYSSAWAAEVQAALGRPLPAEQVSGSAPALADSLVELQRTHRFGVESAIQVFSRALKRGDVASARAAWQTGPPALVMRPLPTRGRLVAALDGRLVEWHRRLAAAEEPRAALEILREQRILTPLRRGPWGVETIHRGLRECWVRRRLIPGNTEWYAGRPVLITETSADLGLSNGDMGVAFLRPEDGSLQVWFESADGTFRALSPRRLPAHETAYAMTVHKSQGSEFQRVLLLLPEGPHPLVNRELIYTAVTRARVAAEIWASEADLTAGLVQVTERHSGLADALWKSETAEREVEGGF